MVDPLTRSVRRGPLILLVLVGAGWTQGRQPGGDVAATAAALADELRDKGRIIYSAQTDSGDWDLFLMRPDGSDRRNVTSTPSRNEAGARFSPDGRKLLYYRMARTVAVDNNLYGTYELVVANADGTGPAVWGSGYPWASWGPASDKLACLSMKGIQIVDLSTRAVVQRMARKGIVQQLVWSPDGAWFAGTANGLGVAWTIGRLSVETGAINAVSETDRYNCTPDWLGDGEHIVYSRGIVPGTQGWAQLWLADGSGGSRRLLYAEEGRHIYGGCLSPDGKYVLFTRSQQDLGTVDNSQTTMAIVRLADTPIIVGADPALHEAYPHAGQGPVLHAGRGWEPHWTDAGIGDSDNP